MQVLFKLVIFELGEAVIAAAAASFAVAEAAVAFLLTAEAATTFLHAAAAFFASIARSAWMRFSFSINWAEVSSLGEHCPMGTS